MNKNVHSHFFANDMFDSTKVFFLADFTSKGLAWKVRGKSAYLNKNLGTFAHISQTYYIEKK